MATKACLVDAVYGHDAIKATWALLTSTNVDGDPLPDNWIDYSDRSVQVKGTFGGATITIQGSNDGGTTWATMNDAFGNALTFTTAGLKQATEVVGQMRPLESAGDGTTSLTVVAICRRPRSGQEA